jgi:hypothetical protein
VSFAAITLCVASQQVFVVVDFVIDSVRKRFDTPSYSYRYVGILVQDASRWGVSRGCVGAPSTCRNQAN